MRGEYLRSFDGPDEVHLRTVARRELKRQVASGEDPSRYCLPPERLAGEGA
jgi:hypothetical protein